LHWTQVGTSVYLLDRHPGESDLGLQVMFGLWRNWLDYWFAS